jgi:type I restriction enzyme R subunit
MNPITESNIETFAIELLEKQGYQYVYAPDIAPDSETPERARFEDVLLLERLRKAVGRINPKIPAEAREDAIKQIQRLNSPELIANNETFHRMLTEGIKESVRSKLKVIVKRTLRQYGYPPDMQALATETVLKQAELIADELTRRG